MRTLKFSSRIRQLRGLAAASAGIGLVGKAVAALQIITPNVTNTGYGYLYYDPIDTTGTKAGLTAPAEPYLSIYNSSDGYFYVENFKDISHEYFTGLDLVVHNDGGSDYLTLLNPGDWVNDSLNFTAEYYAYPPFDIAGQQLENTYYFGYRMTGQGAGNDETWYGYAKVTVNNLPSWENDTLTLVEYRFGNAGEQVQVEIPEPQTGALPLLTLLGAIALRTFSRRKK